MLDRISTNRTYKLLNKTKREIRELEEIVELKLFPMLIKFSKGACSLNSIAPGISVMCYVQMSASSHPKKLQDFCIVIMCMMYIY